MRVFLSVATMGITALTSFVSTAQTKPVTVPMQLTEQGHIMVEAKLNSANTVPMVLDTAASVGLISNDLLGELKLPEKDLIKQEVTGATSTQVLTFANIHSVDGYCGLVSRATKVKVDGWCVLIVFL